MRGLIQRIAAVPPVLRATLAYAVAMAWTKALAMLTLPLLTATLSPTEFGRLELLSSAAEIGGQIAGAGLVDTMFRFAAAPGSAGRTAAARVAGLSLLIGAVGIVAAAALSGTLASWMPLDTPRRDILLLGIAVALNSTIGVPLGWLRMNRRAGAWAGVTMLRATLQAGLLVALVASGYAISGVLWAGCITCVVASSSLTLLQRRETGIAFSPRASLGLLAYGLPLVGGGLAMFVLGTADRWLLAGQVSAAELGQDALAAKVSLIVALFAQPFELWWSPQRLAFAVTQEGLARSGKVVAAGATYLFCMGAATALAAPWLIQLLAPPSYAPAAGMAPFLVLALVCQLICSMANVGCFLGKTGAQPLAINFAAAAIALVLYILLIPTLGVTGAIVATVVAQAARLLISGVLSQRVAPLAWPFGRLASVAAAACVTGSIPLFLGTGTQSALVGLAALATTFGLAVVLIVDRAGLVRTVRQRLSWPRSAAAAA